MRLGVLAYASQTGLGYQTRDYVNYLRPEKVLAVDLSMYNRMPIFPEWYEQNNTQWTQGIPQAKDIDIFLNDLDVVLVGETPLNYYLFSEARARGIKTFQAYNYEFLDFFNHPDWPAPYMLIGPTRWNIENVQNLDIVRNGLTKVRHLSVPLELKLRGMIIPPCTRIGHIIGRPAVHDRNGTLTFLDAIEKLGQRNIIFEYFVYVQIPTDPQAIEYYEPIKRRLYELQNKINLHVVTDTQDNNKLYENIDLLVLPRRYGGLCLPMQEALARGIPVIMTNVSPNSDILPNEWLSAAFNIGNFRGHADIEMYSAEIEDLIGKIRQFQDYEFTQNASKRAAEIARALSWGYLRSQYFECFSQ